MHMKIKSAQLAATLMISLVMLPCYARGGGGFGGGRGGGGFGGRSFGGHEGDFSHGGDFDRGFSHGFGEHTEFNRGGMGGDNGVRNYGGGGFSSISSARAHETGVNQIGTMGGAGRSNIGNISGFHSAAGSEGGWGRIAQNRDQPIGHNTHPWNDHDWADHGNNVRNSFNHYNQFNQTNFNRYGGYNHWGNYGAWNAHAGFWGYPGAWYPGGWSAATAWTCAGFASLGAFVGLASLDQPATYNNVNYEGDNVYIDGQSVGTATDYYQQAQQLAQSGSISDDSSSGTDTNWQPVGVYSLVQGDQTDSTMVMQLAVDQSGTIKGNYYNQITGESSQITGSIDKKTQRMSWMLGNNSSTIFDTTLGNLMKEQSPVLVHYGAGNTQEMALVRLDQPPQQPQQTQQPQG